MLLQTKQKTEANMTITSKTQPLRGLIQTTSYAVSEPLTNITHEFFNKASKEAALDYVIHRNITGSDLVKDESSNHEKQYLSYIIPAAYNAWQELWNTVNPHMKKMIEWKIGNDASKAKLIMFDQYYYGGAAKFMKNGPAVKKTFYNSIYFIIHWHPCYLFFNRY